MGEIITEKNYPIQKLWVIKSIIRFLIDLIVIAIFFILFSDPYFFFLFSNSYNNFSMRNSLFIKFIVIFYLPFALFRLFIAILLRKTFRYSIESHFLTLRQGILSKKQRHIPYQTIQNLFIKQDLFDKIFGLASLTIENASQGADNLVTVKKQTRQRMEMIGFSGNRVNIPGLTKAHAEILKGIILQKMKENPIEDTQSGL